MKRLSATLASTLVGLVSLADAESLQHDPKQLEAQARELVSEGRALEHQGKLVEAKEKYLDAEGVAPSDEALNAIHRINAQQQQQVEALIVEAHHLFDAGKFTESAARLEQALALQPWRPVLHYDLALCYLKLGDRTNAALQLDPVIALLGDRERTALLELRSAVLMGTALPEATAAGANGTLNTFNESYLQEDRDPHAAGGSLCAQSQQLLTAFPANQAVLFNSAKCAAEDARPGDAAQLLRDYARLAPDALDQTDAAALQQVWSLLASLNGEAGQAVRTHYAAASRYLDQRRYNLAIAEYEAAARALPDFPRTQWELAVLYEAYGDTPQATAHFVEFQRLEPRAERKADADLHLSTLEVRRALYDANVAEAEDILGALLRSSLGIDNEGTRHSTRLNYKQWRWASPQYKEATQATERPPQPYAMRELARARDDLIDAVVLFPLGAEANELLALVDLQGFDWPEAYASYDAVASQGFPVSFYAQVISSREKDIVHAVKVEIAADGIRLTYLAAYNTNKETSAPPAKLAGVDQLGNLVVSLPEPPGLQSEGLRFRAADLKGIETDENLVVLKHGDDEIYLAPLSLLTDAPFALGYARSFGNAYTKLFVRYLGYTDAKLGTEGLTAGETLTMGLVIARAAMPAGTLGLGASAAYASAFRTVRLMHAVHHHARRSARLAQAIHNLEVYRSVHQDIRVAKAGALVGGIAADSPIDPASLEQMAGDQRVTLEGTVFKVIPTGPAATPFREHF